MEAFKNMFSAKTTVVNKTNRLLNVRVTAVYSTKE